MKFFAGMFFLSLKRHLKSAASAVFLLMLLALTVAVAFMPGQREESLVRVGLVLPESGGREMARLLTQRRDGTVEYILTDEQTLDKMVLSGRWDCGLVLDEAFDEKLEMLDSRNLVTLKIGPASTVYPLVQEHVAACLTELLTPYIARDFLEENRVDTEGLEQSLMGQGKTAPRVEIKLQTLAGERLQVRNLTDAGLRQMLKGFLAVLMLLWGLLLCVDLGRWLETGGARRLRAMRPAYQLLVPQVLAGTVIPLFWGLALQAVLGGPWSALSWLAFGLVTMAISLFGAVVPRLWQAVPAAAPFLAVECLLLENVLLDMGRRLPLLDILGVWRPVSLYMKGSAGNLSAIPALLAEAALLTALAFVAERRSGKYESDR